MVQFRSSAVVMLIRPLNAAQLGSSRVKHCRHMTRGLVEYSQSVPSLFNDMIYIQDSRNCNTFLPTMRNGVKPKKSRKHRGLRGGVKLRRGGPETRGKKRSLDECQSEQTRRITRSQSTCKSPSGMTTPTSASSQSPSRRTQRYSGSVVRKMITFNKTTKLINYITKTKS